MCGRFTQYCSWRELYELYQLSGDPQNLEPQYNLAPTMPIWTVRTGDGPRALERMRWGLVPSWWKKELRELPSTFNARAETVAAKPMFRAAFKARRCIVPASGFYEWQRLSKTDKQPLHFTLASGEPMSLAGLWETWEDPKSQGERFLSCTIIVTEANELMAKIHNRMPVILAADAVDAWLTGDAGDELLKPCPSDWLEATEVSTYVNSSRHQGPECIEPVEPKLL